MGGNRTVSVNVRVIVATNKNLEEEIAEGRFRKDLYFRINVIPVRVPPLRERGEDIPMLAEYFLKDLAERFGRKPKEFEKAAVETLKRHDWPGNVRELRNTIERLMIMVPGETIGAGDLAYTATGGGEEQPVEEMEFDSLKDAREYFERALIRSKLEQLDYNVADTAKALKIERSHLYRKLKAFGIDIGGGSH